MNATGIVVAAANGISGGSSITPLRRVTTWVASAAGATAATRSFGRRSSTPSPTAVTMPAHSRPSDGPLKPPSSASSGSSPCAHITSRKFSADAWTSIATSPGPGGAGSAALHPSEPIRPGRATSSRRGPLTSGGAGSPARSRGTSRPPLRHSTSGSWSGSVSSRRMWLAASASGKAESRAMVRQSSPAISFAATRRSPVRAADTIDSVGEPADTSHSRGGGDIGMPCSAALMSASSSASASAESSSSAASAASSSTCCCCDANGVVRTSRIASIGSKCSMFWHAASAAAIGSLGAANTTRPSWSCHGSTTAGSSEALATNRVAGQMAPSSRQ